MAGDTAGNSRLVAGRPLEVHASHRHRSRHLHTLLDWLQEHWGEYGRLNSGSALKFANWRRGLEIFTRVFHPAVSGIPPAGQAVLEAAGGAVVGMDGKPLRYNTRDSLYSPHFYAIADPGHPLWRGLIGWHRLIRQSVGPGACVDNP